MTGGVGRVDDGCCEVDGGYCGVDERDITWMEDPVGVEVLEETSL